MLLAVEGTRLGAMGRDARRLVLARMVLDHRLRPRDPLGGSDSPDGQVDAVLDDDQMPIELACALVAI